MTNKEEKVTGILTDEEMEIPDSKTHFFLHKCGYSGFRVSADALEITCPECLKLMVEGFEKVMLDGKKSMEEAEARLSYIEKMDSDGTPHKKGVV